MGKAVAAGGVAGVSSSDESFSFVCWIFGRGGFPVVFPPLSLILETSASGNHPIMPMARFKTDSSHDHPQSPPTGAFLHDTSRALFGRQGRRPVGSPESVILAQKLLRLFIVLLNKTHAGFACV